MGTVHFSFPSLTLLFPEGIPRTYSISWPGVLTREKKLLADLRRFFADKRRESLKLVEKKEQ